MLTRRSFLTHAAAFSAAALAPPRGSMAADPLRPTFHFLAPHNWMNDPNGPIIWRGNVHLFYQVNPHGAQWGDISWGHAVSPDMVHWRHLPVAMQPQPGAADSFGVYSGSAIADGDRVLAFYTAVEQVQDASLATIHEPTRELREQQNVAVASDPMLGRWERQQPPLLTTPPLQPAAGFRDPSVWREGDTWYMIVGSGVIGQYGCVLLYRASVPAGLRADWQFLHPLLTAPGDGGNTSDTVGAGTMWECPDLFQLDGHHVLLYSTMGKVFWTTGQLNRSTLLFEPRKRGVIDSGAFYAPKSMAGPSGERVLWGWIPETRPTAESVAAGWAGCMSLPRVLNVDDDGNLRLSVAPVVDRMLVTGPVQSSAMSAHVPGLAARLTAHLPRDKGAITIWNRDASLLELQRTGAREISINGQAVEAPLDERITAYIDGSVIEIFFGDRAAHTLRAYPALREGDGLTASASGSAEFALQRMQPISHDRLTS